MFNVKDRLLKGYVPIDYVRLIFIKVPAAKGRGTYTTVSIRSYAAQTQLASERTFYWTASHRVPQDDARMTCRASTGSETGPARSTADYTQPTPNTPTPI